MFQEILVQENVKLISNSKIERNFNFSEFVLEFEKQNFSSMGEDDYAAIYFDNEKLCIWY